MRGYQAVIYDIDGTLLDTVHMNLYPLLRIIREELGEERTLEQVTKYMAYPGLKTIEELGIPNPETVYQRWVRYVNEYEEGATPYEGIRELLDTLRAQGVRQAVVSSKKRAQYQIDMGGQGLDGYMETAVLEEDTVRHKPHPDPLLACLERLGVPPEGALYVGDTRSDSLAARAAGVDFVYARWGSVEEQPVEDAVCQVDTPAALLEWLVG